MKTSLAEHSPGLVKEWDYEKNGFEPKDVSHGSRKKVWWKGVCGHEWEARIDGRTNPKTKCGCPVCRCGRKQECLLQTHPQTSSEWHPTKNADLGPKDVTAGTHRQVWWKGICGHEWEASVANRTKISRPSGCPYCNNRKASTTNSLSVQFPKVAEEFHPTKNEPLTPHDLVATCYTKVWWLGKCGHEWQTKLKTRTRKERPACCPICKESRGEREVEKVLQELGVPYSKQVRYTDCRFKKPLPFDFEVVGTQGPVLVEYNGLQHYEPVEFGGDAAAVFKGIQIRDEIKRKWCESTGRRLIVIPYTQFDNIGRILRQEVCHPQADS